MSKSKGGSRVITVSHDPRNSVAPHLLPRWPLCTWDLFQNCTHFNSSFLNSHHIYRPFSNASLTLQPFVQDRHSTTSSALWIQVLHASIPVLLNVKMVA